MKKYITFLLLLPLALYCQVIDTAETKKIKIGITYSPDFSYRGLKPDASNKWIADIRDTLETPKFGYTTGINVMYTINKKIAISTGILFSDKGERTKEYSISNSPSTTTPATNQFVNHDYYLDIPIQANYIFGTGKLKWFVTAGVSANIFINQQVVTTLSYRDGYTETSKLIVNPNFSRVNMAGVIGAGIDYTLTSKLSWIIEPLYRHSITSIIKAPIKTFLYSAGLNMGIYYKL